ncbi:MAG: PhnD/SsuA/transferrin family substrate-binding protein [Chromatiaceae bacterium]|nr:PhnD/SsuA/transferrin family substrate-binding protein [Chromatiaceae bacterium]
MKRVFRTMLLLAAAAFSSLTLAAETIDLWFAPGWKANADQAKEITNELSNKSGVQVRPRIANSYPQILDTFATGEPALVYVGSFVQAIIRARDLGEGLVQAANGKEFYSGVLVYPKGEDPVAILNGSPDKVAYAVGASSGESSAKAATNGQASIPTKSHAATSGAVKAGKAKAGVVKNWWWAGNGNRFPELAMYEIPGISETRNPDNVLSASKGVSADMKSKITAAAKASKEVFGAAEMVDFDPTSLDFSLSLMDRGKINPKTYSW